MRIAQVAPLAEAVPPRTYGGTERVVSYLTEELVALGHDVTLFASADSQTSACLVPIVPLALRLDPNAREPVAPYVRLVQAVSRRADEFDVIHFHIDHFQLPVFGTRPYGHLTTMHGRLDLPELSALLREFPDVPLVSISDAQRAPIPEANFIGTVQHGLPINLLQPTFHPKGYLACLGRVCPEKGIDRAIRIARAAGLPLRIAAKVDADDQAYFETEIAPLLEGSDVEFIGEIGQDEMGAFLGDAAALLFPIDWPEPFGLVMIEAMACATPVIAFDRGAVPEVLENGVSGFIVQDEGETIAAFARLSTLRRHAVRAAFERRFTSARMATDYVRLYEKLARPMSRTTVARRIESISPDISMALGLATDRARKTKPTNGLQSDAPLPHLLDRTGRGGSQPA